MNAPRPLTGLTVLDFTRVYSGPYATLLLSDLGARVVKVEHPDGGDDSRAFGPFVGGMSGYFETVNRGKQSIAVDYRVEAGQALLLHLAARVDALIENFRPGQMARYCLDYETLRGTCPQLVYVSISGFGQTGPYAGHGCYDIIAQAMGGLMSLTGAPELPTKTGPAIADAISGLTAAVGLLAALRGRDRTGHGAHVDVAMMEAVFACLENALVAYDVTGESPPRRGNTDAVLAPFDSFRTSDGWIVIGVGNDRLWRALADLIAPGLADDLRFATNADRVRHYDALHPILERWCREQSAEVALTRLHAAGVPSGPIRAIDELACDPHLEIRGMLAQVGLANSEQIKVPGSPIHIASAASLQFVRGPLLGEHTRAVLGGLLGLGEEALDSLLATGVIAEPPRPAGRVTAAYP